MTSGTSSSSGDLTARLAGLPEDFSEFADIYDRELQPVLQEKEQERKAAVANARNYGVIGVVVGVVAAAGLIFLIKSPFAAIPGGIIGFGALAYGYSGIRTITQQVKTLIIDLITSRFGLIYSEKAELSAEANLDQQRTVKVVPDWDRKTLSDEIAGERDGVAFEFFEAHLEDKRTTRDSTGRSSTTWVTVFRGQCWVIDSPKTFHGTTRVSRDSGVFNSLGAISSDISRAKLESPEFEKAFEVYTTDQVESRYLLTPDVMQAFLDLEAKFKGSKFRATFHGNKIYAALEGGELFETGSAFSSVDDPQRVGDLLEDIAVVFHLVDVLGK